MIKCLVLISLVSALSLFAGSENPFASKQKPAEILRNLKAGNERFVKGQSLHPHADALRRRTAAEKNQGDYAVASILSCSDSRVPVELIFDAGVMDLFVIRVPGNICQDDEIGSVEYGVCHVFTPVVVVLGHSDCGAVTAACAGVEAHASGHKLERSIPKLLKPIKPVIRDLKKKNPSLSGKSLVESGIRENVYREIENLLIRSAAVRSSVKQGRVLVTGAIYDIRSGRVEWLDSKRIDSILKKVDSDSSRETKEYED